MASFEDLLMQTMPFAGALNFYNVRRAETLAASRVAEEKDGTPTPDPGEFPGLFSGQTIGYDDMMVDRLEVDESFEVAKPVIEASDYETPHEVPIWRWKHEADTPWRIRNVSCRSRSASYRTYAVATSIEWGFESETDKGVLKNCIRIVNLAGKLIELPLTQDFGRVGRRGFPPRPPTDPDVRNSRIRLLGECLRYVAYRLAIRGRGRTNTLRSAFHRTHEIAPRCDRRDNHLRQATSTAR